MNFAPSVPTLFTLSESRISKLNYRCERLALSFSSWLVVLEQIAFSVVSLAEVLLVAYFACFSVDKATFSCITCFLISTIAL